MESRLENKELWEELVLSTPPAPKRIRTDVNDQYYGGDNAILPEGWIMHKPVFYLSKIGDQWSTYHGRNTFVNQVVYPNFVSNADRREVFETSEAEWVQVAVNKADELGFTRIDVFCGAIIPTERVDRNNNKEPRDVL
jgi:hypothetical protein